MRFSEEDKEEEEEEKFQSKSDAWTDQKQLLYGSI
jgi:hypothetical protein